MKVFIFIIAIIVVLSITFVGFGGCSRNVDNVKANAKCVFLDNGFTVVGYHGYQLSPITGGYVWYTLKKKNITYEAAITKWFDEYHIYNLSAIDAIKP